MKILQQGTKPVPKPPEWVGMKLKCGCGCEVELEAGDNVATGAERSIGGRRWVQIYCPTCGASMEAYLPGGINFDDLRKQYEEAAKAQPRRERPFYPPPPNVITPYLDPTTRPMCSTES